MKIRIEARSKIFALLSGAALFLTACSYSTDFVVINESGQPIEVRYKVKKGTLGPLNVAGIPVTVEASELTGKGGQDWKPLTNTELQVDDERSTVTVRLGPGEALRVASLKEYGGHKDPGEANHFPIEEIEMTGSTGRVVVAGTQTRLAFSEVSSALYSLTYK